MKKIIVSLIIVVITFIFSTGIAYALEISDMFYLGEIEDINEQISEENAYKDICEMAFDVDGDSIIYTMKIVTDESAYLTFATDDEIFSDTFQTAITDFEQEDFSYYPEVYDTTFILRITDANDTVIKEASETIVNPYYDESAEAAHIQEEEESFLEYMRNTPIHDPTLALGACLGIAALLTLAPSLFYRLLRGCEMTPKGAGLFAIIEAGIALTIYIIFVPSLMMYSFQNVSYVSFVIFAVISYGILRFGAAKQKESSRNVEQD